MVVSGNKPNLVGIWNQKLKFLVIFKTIRKNKKKKLGINANS